MKPSTVVVAKWLGRVPYRYGLEIQKNIVDQLLIDGNVGSTPGTVLLMESHPVYTVGIRRNQYSIPEQNRLRSLGAEFYESSRGGLITFHGPGQLLAYPLLNLHCWNKAGGARWYVESLEELLIQTCRHFLPPNIPVGRNPPNAGIWVENEKLAAIGVRISHGCVTSHGIGLNCCTDLGWFSQIVPCGLEGKGVTSLSRLLNRTISVEEVVPKFLEAFANVFHCRLQQE